MTKVENSVKNSRKTMLKTNEKLWKTFTKIINHVKNLTSPLTFPNFPTDLLTTTRHLFNPYFFHYSTPPTTKTTKYIIYNSKERNLK